MNKESERRLGVWKTTLFKLVAFLVVFATMSFTASADEKLSTVYHVYIDDHYVGSVADKSIVESHVEQIIQEAQDTYEDYNLELGNKVTYIAEQVFRSNADDTAVGSKIKELATVQAKATAIQVEDKAIVYLKDSVDAEKVINELKTEYVSKEELKEYEEWLKTNHSLPELRKDESRVTNVSIQEPYSFKDGSISPKEILTIDEAVKMLQKGTLEEKKHTVKQGEAFEIIAEKYDLSMEQLKDLNEGITEESILQIGQELNTLVTKPLLHIVVEREQYKEESVSYDKEIIEDNSMPKGETKVKQEGQNGVSGITYKIKEENGQQKDKEAIKETVIKEPTKEIIIKGTKVIPSRGTGSFAWPASGGYISSKMGQRWGQLHKGIDIARPSNGTIKAADNGIVVSAGWDSGGYGNKIVIDHQNGFRTVYAHLKSVEVKPGQKVEKGSKIGIMGSTGDSTGVHLHFEVYKNGSLQNPLSYL